MARAFYEVGNEKVGSDLYIVADGFEGIVGRLEEEHREYINKQYREAQAQVGATLNKLVEKTKNV